MSANAKRASPKDAIDPSKALVPSVQRVNETRVRHGFWPKVRRTAARIPFADHLLSVWYAAKDPETPTAAKGVMLGALAYFVLPFDVVPDVILGVGFTDDLTVLMTAIALVSANMRPEHRRQAQETLARIREEQQSG